MVAMGVVVASVGCSSDGASGSQDPAALEGVEWHLSGSSEAAVMAEGSDIVVVFDAGKMSGFSGVNRFNGRYSANDDGSFEGGPFASTMMAGPEPLMKAETEFLGLLEKITAFAVDGEGMTLTTEDGKSLEFTAAPAVELAGTSWTVTGYNTGAEAVISVAEGSELTLEFGDDGTVSGSGGVNTFSGPYEYDAEGTISIGPLTQTLMAGDEALMEQETRYFAALEASKSWDVFNGALSLRDAEDAMQVNAVTR
jgi:heat shock protein HslJ